MATTKTRNSKKLPKKFNKFFARIRSRHGTHNVLRKHKALLFDVPVVIRLGSTTRVDKAKIEINSVQAVNNCSDKLKMKTLFAEAKIQSPAFFKKAELEKMQDNEIKFPLVKKTRFHSRGNGMKFIENKAQLKAELKAATNTTYFEEYFNGSREYRFHVSDLGCFYTCRKMRKNEAKDRWYFNSRNCVWIVDSNPLYQKPKTFNKIVAECKKALKALKLDFAAFDVRVKKDGSFTILEGNSAPSFGDITAEKYLEHLPLLVKHKQ